MKSVRICALAFSLVFVACGGEVSTREENVAAVEQAWPYDYPCAVPQVMPETGQVGDLRPRHDIRGYLNGSSAVPNQYLLEAGVTLRATQAACLPSVAPTGTFIKLTVQFVVFDAGGQPTTLFTGQPMGTETTLPAGDFRQLEVTVHQQTCTNMAGGAICGSPTVKAQRTYQIAVQPRSTFCNVTFSRTQFEIEDTNLVGAEAANVTSVTDPGFLGVNNHSFRARGVSTANATIVNGKAEKPFVDVLGTSPFGVHSWEPCLGEQTTAKSGCSLPQYSPLESSDTFRPRALRFARVDGSNTITKLPYSYTCTQPSIVRDRIAACSGSTPDTYYRLPFLNTQQVEVSQGNCGDYSHECGSDSEFALDFRADKGTPVLAARGGVVVKVVHDVTGHCDSKAECAELGIPASGNYVRVQHQDNTFAVYAHLSPDSAFVSLGQTIKRGTMLALSGYTGHASGPHLHFLVRQALSISGSSIKATYQYFNNEPLTSVNLHSCLIPAEDGDHWSNNVWTFP